MADAIRQLGISEVTYYRWRKEYGVTATESADSGTDTRSRNIRSAD